MLYGSLSVLSNTSGDLWRFARKLPLTICSFSNLFLESSTRNQFHSQRPIPCNNESVWAYAKLFIFHFVTKHFWFRDKVSFCDTFHFVTKVTTFLIFAIRGRELLLLHVTQFSRTWLVQGRWFEQDRWFVVSLLFNLIFR